MEVTCESCNSKLNIPDEKVPKGQVVKFTCPKCKGKVTVDGRKAAQAEPASAPEPETPPAPEEKPPQAKTPGRIDEEAAELGFLEEGVQLALVLPRDPDEDEKIKAAVEELGYKYVTSENTRKAVGNMRIHRFDVVILSDQFDGIDLKQSPVLQYLNHLSISVRRRTFLALVGDDFRTMDNMAAFSLSANMVMNREDLDKMHLILKQGVMENDRFYKVYKETLSEIGKA
jgi:hypothetical protein